MARHNDRGGRDAAGFGPYHRPDAELVPLRELGDWDLAKGEPDIRGWEVRTVSGRTIGTVRDLLIDRQSREAVLLDLDLTGGDRRARAPLRAAQIDRVARVIRMDSADLLGGELAADSEAVRSDRPVERPVTAAADVGDHPGRTDDQLTPPVDTRRSAEERLAGGGIDETVVERRPVVYEEVVVRRRNVDSDEASGSRDASGPADRPLDRDADPRT